MSLEASEVKKTCEQVSDMVDNSLIVFDNVVQRSFTWEPKRMSLFVHSIILHFPIPPVYAKRSPKKEDQRKKCFDILDGQQRLTTISKFMNDGFGLSELPEVTYYDDVSDEEVNMDISGFRFSELPEDIKKRIRGAIITIIYFDSLIDNEERELFKRLNNGRPLTSKNKALASCKDLDHLLEIGNHKVFNILLTKNGRKNKLQVPYTMKIWCMLNQNLEDISFETRNFTSLLEETVVTEKQEHRLVIFFNYILEVFGKKTNSDTYRKNPDRKKIVKETHIVSLVPFIRWAIDSEIGEEQFGEWVDLFYNGEEGISISAEYNDACKGGSAKNINIQNRHYALEKSYKEFFDIE